MPIIYFGHNVGCSRTLNAVLDGVNQKELGLLHIGQICVTNLRLFSSSWASEGFFPGGALGDFC